MIHITAQMRVLVAIEPVDGRKGIETSSSAFPPKSWQGGRLLRNRRSNPFSAASPAALTNVIHITLGHHCRQFARNPQLQL